MLISNQHIANYTNNSKSGINFHGNKTSTSTQETSLTKKIGITAAILSLAIIAFGLIKRRNLSELLSTAKKELNSNKIKKFDTNTDEFISKGETKIKETYVNNFIKKSNINNGIIKDQNITNIYKEHINNIPYFEDNINKEKITKHEPSNFKYNIKKP